MGDTKTSDNNNDTDMPKDEKKVKHNNNISGRGRGHHRGSEHLAEDRGRFHIFNRFNRGRGQDYRARGQAANFRGRYGYGRRGRGVGWYGGRGAGHNGQFYKPRMINTGPWSAASAHRDRQQPRSNSQQPSTHPMPTKIYVNPSTDFNPHIPPPACYNSYPQGCLQPSSYYHPQAGAATACSYYRPQAGESFVPDSASGLVVVNNGGPMYNYQGGSSVQVEGSTHPVVSQDTSVLHVVAQMPRQEVLETAMSGLGLASSEGMQSPSSGGLQLSSNINGEKCNNNNQGEETPSEKEGAGEVPSANAEISKSTAYMRSSAGEENTKLTRLKNKSGQEASGVPGGEASGVTGGETSGVTGAKSCLGNGGAVHLATVTNPLSALGQSVDQDKQLVEAFAGVEMRPVSPFPPNYGLQYFFIPYGTPPPQHVIPVMVFPVLPVGHSPQANQVAHVREAEVEDGQVKQNGESAQENEFPPPRSLLPSYMGSMDLPCSPNPVEFYQPEPSPVEIYQPFINPWPHQFMMDPLAPNLQSDRQSCNGNGQ